MVPKTPPRLALRERGLTIKIRALAKAFGRHWALREVDFEASSGEAIALLGPNGAGKTTLLRILAGLISPTRGEVSLDGHRPGVSAPGPRGSIGYLSPGLHLYDHLTARENLALFLSLYGKSDRLPRAAAALEAVGLGEWADEFVLAFSSGMRCRLALAKWALLEPSLLLLDEPYGPLDRSGVELLDSHVRQCLARGGTVILATHHAGHALALCPRALVLERGKLVYDGRSEGAERAGAAPLSSTPGKADRCAW
jgi:heme ABC exporter ATP-binding subunit CcmA